MSNQLTSLWRLARYENGFPFKPDDFGPIGTPVIRIRQLVDPSAKVDLTERHIPARYLLADGDLIFSWSGSLAVRPWDRGPAWLNQHLFKVIPTSGVSQGWLRWIIDASIPRFEGMMHGSAMTHLNLDMLKQIKFEAPSLDEQRRIADFLDAETARIDMLMRAREAQIVRLSERHTSLLVRLVSGLGEPAHFRRMAAGDRGILSEMAPDDWVVLPLRRIMQKLNRPARPTDAVVTAYRDGEVTLRANRRDDGYTFSDAETGYQGVEPGDLVFHALDGFAGAVGISDARGKATPVYHVCSMRHDDDARFMSLALRAMGMLGYLEVQAGNVRQRSVDFRSWETFAHLPLPRPPRHVQRKISETLTESRAWMARATSVLNHQRSLLAERRQALITAVVTGQVDVTTARCVSLSRGVAV